MRANLAPEGLLVFDAITSSGLQAFVAGSGPARVGEWTWEGLSPRRPSEGVFEARISGGGVMAAVVERHRPITEVRAALDRVGLECLAAFGQREEETGLLLDPSADEERDERVIYVARTAPS